MPFEPAPKESTQYTVRRYEGARAVYTTSKSIDDVIKAVHGTVAPFPAPMKDVIAQTQTGTAFQSHLEDAVKKTKNPSGMFIFYYMPHGEWFHLFKPDAPRAHKFVIGNPIALKQIVMYNMEAALHAPWDFMLIEQQDKGTEIIYDLPTAIMQPESSGASERLQEEAAKLEDTFRRLVESWL